MINNKAVIRSLSNFKNEPFDYCVIDNFFDIKIARELSCKFPKYSSKVWHEYKNKIEDKKTCNNWNHFDDLTYGVFCHLNSNSFVNLISQKIKINLIPDPGLHGGGWHIHANKGNLNPHLDYTIHPKMSYQRRLNLIVYLEESYKTSYGGHLGLWEHNEKENLPGCLKKEIFPKFNRAIIFDTSQNSWHGLSRKIKLPRGIFRKSIAVYYLCKPKKMHLQNQRALFAPRDDQKKSKNVLDLIKLRSSNNMYHKAYIKK